jgi:serine/threonine-protein phosphatase 2A regulatory subunit B
MFHVRYGSFLTNIT